MRVHDIFFSFFFFFFFLILPEKVYTANTILYVILLEGPMENARHYYAVVRKPFIPLDTRY